MYYNPDRDRAICEDLSSSVIWPLIIAHFLQPLDEVPRYMYYKWSQELYIVRYPDKAAFSLDERVLMHVRAPTPPSPSTSHHLALPIIIMALVALTGICDQPTLSPRLHRLFPSPSLPLLRTPASCGPLETRQRLRLIQVTYLLSHPRHLASFYT